MLVHDGEQSFKVHLAQIDKHKERIIYLQEKVTENHKEMVAHQYKLKPILEGMENKKWVKFLDGLKCDVDQYVMVTMDFTPPSVYRHLQVTIISDNGWCWALIWRKLSF